VSLTRSRIMGPRILGRCSRVRRLILWDIDGTILRSGRAVSEAYERALRHVYRLEGEIARISYGGKTDGQIALETLALHDLAEENVLLLLDTFRETYTAEIEAVRQRMVEDVRVLPGVRELLDRLDALGAQQSLLTGNFEAVARIKLACAGLERYFDFATGAFGSDHHDRDCLVPIAIEKTRRACDIRFTPDQVVVIGDTPRDIACARAGGARVVAVATGRFEAQELARRRPDALLESLSDTDAALSAVLGA
jgi:phosphoglycolate phosphatase